MVVAAMAVTDVVIADLKRHEGLRLKPYRDMVGKLTIGYGRNLDDVGLRESEADQMLSNDVMGVYEQLLDALPWAAMLSAERQAVLVNMAFNLGLDGLLGFKNTLAAIRAGKYQEAASMMLESKWAQQVKGRATELASRMQRA